MTPLRTATLLALLLAAVPGCGGEADEPRLVIDGPRLAMKCSFSTQSGASVVPGEAFLYLLYDSRDEAYVVHGIAKVQEDLMSEELGLQGDLPPHAAWRENGFKWTERDADGDEVTNWIGNASSVGERFLNTGQSHLSRVAYPECFAREL